MKDKKLFPELPQDLSSLSDEELKALRTQIQKRVEEVKTRDPEVLGDLTMREVLEQTTAAVEGLEKVIEIESTRIQAQTDFDAELSRITEKVEAVAEAPEVAEVEAVEEAVVEEPVAEEVVAVEETAVETPEPVLVAAADIPAARKVTPESPRIEVLEAPSSKSTLSMVASSGIPGFQGGQPLNERSLAEAVVAARHTSVATPAGFADKVVVASADWSHLYPESRILNEVGRPDAIMAKIRETVGVEALVASGGLCAPVTPYYELMNVAVAARPVRDAIASFNAVRGGLQFAAPPTIADVTGVGIKTEAQDAAGGTFAVKSCQVVDCPAFDQVDLSMIYRCLQFGNLNSRAFPEMVAQFNELTLAAHARLAEQALLDGISGSSTAVTTSAVYGATSSIIYGLLRAASGMRSRLRMDPNVNLRVLAPEWLPDLIAADLVNSQFIRFEYARQDIEALLQRYGVTVSWYLDTNTGGGQVIGAQSAGALLDFPDTVVYYMFPEGSYLFLDGGSLDLGIVRDSTLNSTNDFQIFAETFENIAFVGPESFKVTATVCPTGTTAGTATAITC